MNTQPAKTPAFPIDPKVSGQGVVYRKDGTVSKPDIERKEDGRNSDKRS